MKRSTEQVLRDEVEAAKKALGKASTRENALGADVVEKYKAHRLAVEAHLAAGELRKRAEDRVRHAENVLGLFLRQEPLPISEPVEAAPSPLPSEPLEAESASGKRERRKE